MSLSAGSALFNALVTVAVGPGILAHEYAHVLACRLTGVDVVEWPSVDLVGDAAYFEHEPVETFAQDVTIATAPLVGNSTLALGAFLTGQYVSGLPTLLFGWLGVGFGLTALPSHDDTASLVPGVETLPRWSRPVGYLLAVPLHAVSYSVFVAGLLALGWTGTLYGTTSVVVP